METQDFVNHIKELYKVEVSEEQRKTLDTFLQQSDIGKAPYRIRPISNVDDLRNKIMLYSTLDDELDKFHLEEVVYAMKPFLPDITMEYDATSKHDVIETKGFYPHEYDNNIVIVRTSTYDKIKRRFAHNYDIYIFNSKLNVVGSGIMFEDI
jgi:hypothetical protein